MPYLKVFRGLTGCISRFSNCLFFGLVMLGFSSLLIRSKVVFGLCGRLLTEDNYFSACFFYFFFCFFAEDFGFY